MSRIKKENDTVIVRIFCALFILGFFAFAAGGPLVLSIIGYQHEVWLLHGMNYQPDIITHFVIWLSLIAIFAVSLVGCLVGLYMAYDVLTNGITHNPHIPHEPRQDDSSYA